MNGSKKEGYRLLKSDRKYDGKVIKLRVDEVEFPNKKAFTREVIEHRGAVGIVPLNSDNKVILIKQYRHAAGDFLWEIPAGTMDEVESAEECAFRELKEETGAVATDLVKLAEFYTSPGYSNEKLILYLAVVGEEGIPQPEDDEFLEIEKVDLKQALDLIDDGEIEDAKTIIGICLAIKYQESLNCR